MGEPAGNLEIARKYLQALGRGETGAALGSFFAPDVVLRGVSEPADALWQEAGPG
jgi:hypothetical protein